MIQLKFGRHQKELLVDGRHNMPQRPMLLQNSIRKKSRASKAIGLWRYGILLIIGAAVNKNTGVKDAYKNACCSILCQVQSIKDKLAAVEAYCRHNLVNSS